ncbi:hypothetical protein [Brevibacterium sandarakinum]|uniref:hypothetical protein n=1 Tax=Brevibacterium sandarakinum TaxID=629680 RepID=UPI000AEDC438|nr:hypothetical protein [Brevibacterium sandarakinum]
MSEQGEVAVTRILEGNLGVHMNGRSLPGEGPRLDLLSPMTGTPLGSLSEASTDQLDAAVGHAWQAFASGD